MSADKSEEGTSRSTFYQRYHDVQKGDIAVNQLNIKAFWARMNTELATFQRDDVSTAINEQQLMALMTQEANANSGSTTVSINAAKVLSKACEMFALELTMRAYQCKMDNADNTLREEDVIRALSTSEPHDMFVP